MTPLPPRSNGADPIPAGLASIVADRRLIPFVGAGMSSAVGLPNWHQLLKEVHHTLQVGSDFAQLSKNCDGDPLRIAEYLLLSSGGAIGPIRHAMTTLLATPKQFISSAHVDLLNLGAPVIYTTNYDALIEDTAIDIGRPLHVAATLRELTVGHRSDSSELIKFHGDLRHDESLVLTESSYFERMDLESALDLRLRSDLLYRGVLFIGYGFGDINIRMIWSKLMRLMSDIPERDRPESFILRLDSSPEREELDRAVGLTTIVLDPNGDADDHATKRAMLEDFLVQLSLCRPTAQPMAPALGDAIASPGLLRQAAELVRTRGSDLSPEDETVLGAASSRQLIPQVVREADDLLNAFADASLPAHLRDVASTFGLNYSMTLGSGADETGRK